MSSTSHSATSSATTPQETFNGAASARTEENRDKLFELLKQSPEEIDKEQAMELVKSSVMQGQDRSGYTLLSRCIVMGHLDILQALLDNGAMPSETDGSGSKKTAYGVAINQNNAQALGLLLDKYPLSIYGFVTKAFSMFDLVFLDNPPIEITNCVCDKCFNEINALPASTFFTFCALEKSPLMLKRMIENGLDPLMTNTERDCVLHHTHEPEMIKYFVEKGVSINHQNASGLTPLHVMVDYANTDTISALIECGANPLIRDNYGRLPRNALEEARAAFDNPSPAYNDVEEILKKAELKSITTLQSPLKKMVRMRIKKPGAG